MHRSPRLPNSLGTPHHAIFMQFFVERHPADAQLRSSAEAVVLVPPQCIGDPEALGVILGAGERGHPSTCVGRGMESKASLVAVGVMLCWNCSGRSSSWISWPRQSAMARSIVLRSSRILPGQWWSCKARSASTEIPSTVPRPSGGELGDELHGEVRDRIAPVAERRQSEGDDVEAVVKIGTEPVGGRFLVERAVAGGDQAGLHRE